MTSSCFCSRIVRNQLDIEIGNDLLGDKLNLSVPYATVQAWGSKATAKAGLSTNTYDTDLDETEEEVAGFKPAIDEFFNNMEEKGPNRLISFLHSASEQFSLDKKTRTKSKVPEAGRSPSYLSKANRDARRPTFDQSSVAVELNSGSVSNDTVRINFQNKSNLAPSENTSKIQKTRLLLLGNFNAIDTPKSNLPFVVRPTVLKLERAKYQGAENYPNKSVPVLGEIPKLSRPVTPQYQLKIVDCNLPSFSRE